jgi:hypothetical protein
MENPLFRSLYENVSRACCFISVFLGDEQISKGTGFAIQPDGQVVTAAHVVTGRMPIREEDYRDPNARVFCKFAGLPAMEYSVVVCGITAQVPQFRRPVQIDQALLRPKEPSKAAIPHIHAVQYPPALGEDVFMAGYSDELELPFDVGRQLRPETHGAAEFFREMERGYLADMMGPLIKRGVVGNTRRIVAESSAQSLTLECDVFYVDNSMHSGASGGPVFNRGGLAVGVITQRAVTEAQQQAGHSVTIPSGATVALGLQPLELVCSRINSGQL